MKATLLFLVTLLPTLFYGQLSVSLSEIGRTENNNTALIEVVSGSKHLLDAHLYYVGKVNYQRKHLVWNGSLSFFKEKTAQFGTHTSYQSGGGSSPSYSSNIRYSSILHFSYLAVRLGGDYAFDGKSLLFKKVDASLRFGFFLQLDIPVTFWESNHSKYIKEGNNNNAQHVYVTTRDETIYEEFQSVTDQRMVPSLGFSISKQFTIAKNFFVQLNTSAGFHYKTRFATTFINSNLGYNNIYYFLEAGFGIGYTFPVKPKKLEQ